MITYSIVYVVGHIVGAITDRNRAAILTYAALQYTRARDAIKARFQ